MMLEAATPFAPSAATPLAGRVVLQITPTLDGGAAARTILDIAAALSEAGARPLVASSGGRLVSELQARGGLWVPFPADTRNPLAMLGNVRTLAQLIRSEGPAIVHAQSRASAWVALGATRLTQTPLVTTYHGATGGRHAIKLQYNSVMARGDAVLVNSHFVGEAIVGLYPWARDRVRVIWPGIDLRAFSPAAVDVARVLALRESWGVEPDGRIVLMPARFADGKGHRVLVEAAALLKARGRADFTVVMACDAPGGAGLRGEIEAMARERGIGDLIRCVADGGDLPAALVAASVVVVPATRPEAFGLTAVEAQAMGKPVVVSDCGAIPEAVLAPPAVQPEAATGWRVRAGDAAALADAIDHVLGMGASALDALAGRARTHAEQQFGRDRMTEAVLDAYGAVLDSRMVAPMRHAA